MKPESNLHPVFYNVLNYVIRRDQAEEIEFLRSENVRLQNKSESDRAYIKALQDECSLAHSLISEYKKQVSLLTALNNKPWQTNNT